MAAPDDNNASLERLATRNGEPDWEQEIASFLERLSSVQEQVLALLAEKRQLLAKADQPGLVALQTREREAIQALQECHAWREEFLRQAKLSGLPGNNLRELTASLSRDARQQLHPRIQAATSRARLLQHDSITNWLVNQKTLIHLSQILEIIATGGQLQPTYGKENQDGSRGSLVDQAA